MKFAFDFRKTARESLTGKWLLALVAGLIVSILGGISSEGPSLKLNFSSGEEVNFSFAGQEIASANLVAFLTGTAIIIGLVALIFAFAYFILGSVVAVGYAQFNLDLVDGKEPELGTLFSHYKNWATTSVSALLRALYVALWSLLLIIPGIVASYSYSMTDYILAENPSLTASQAIDKSKTMMYGNKWRLFCLHFSFIGWDLLAFLTFGIGYLWLTPYKQAAIAAFYRDVYTIEGGITSGKAVDAAFEETTTDNSINE